MPTASPKFSVISQSPYASGATVNLSSETPAFLSILLCYSGVHALYISTLFQYFILKYQGKSLPSLFLPAIKLAYSSGLRLKK